MATDMVSLQINEDMVKPILEKQIQAAIMANIGDPSLLIEKVVARALSVKVDDEGKVNSYSSYNKYDYIESLTAIEIRKAAKEALGEWLKENMALVKEMVIKEMNKPNRQRSIANAFANAVEESLSCNWNFKCDIQFQKKD